MKPRNLLIAAVVLAALSGGVWYAKRHPDLGQTTSTTPPAPKIADIPGTQVKEIELTKKGAPTVTLQREGSKWSITTPEALPADQDTVSGIVSSLSPITADSVVEDKTTNPGQFGLTNPSLVVKVTDKNGKTQTLTFGDDLPAGSLVYAEYNSNPKVYAVSSSVKSSFDKSLNDLRDKRLLTFDSNKLTGVELDSSKGGAIDFGKNNQNDWVILKPKPYRADSFQVEDLVRKLGDAKMDLTGTTDDQKKAEAAFAAGTLAGTAKVTDASGTETLEVKKDKTDYYARSSVVKGVYKVSNDLGTEVAKSLDDFRNKKLFDFGFVDPMKVELQQGASDKAYVKSGQDWKLNGKTIDPASIQAFIDKLRDLAATKFVDTGFTTPEFTVTVVSNDGKRVEKVEFAKVADGYIAQREGEPALYQLDAKTVDDILRAGSDIRQATGKK